MINRKNLITEFIESDKKFLFATNENAPFYPSKMREIANQIHLAAKELGELQLTEAVKAEGGEYVFNNKEFISACNIHVREIIIKTDILESLIRERLEIVRVIKVNI